MPEKQITAAEAQPGMILVQDVMDKDGRVLIPQGVRLTPMYLSRLLKWGVANLVIEETAPAAPPEPNAMPMPTRQANATQEQQVFAQAVATAIQARFAMVENDPLMMQLRSVALRQLLALGPNGIPGGRPDGVHAL